MSINISDYYPNRIKHGPTWPADDWKIKAIGQYQIDHDLTITQEIVYSDEYFDPNYDDCYGQIVDYRPDGEQWIDYVPISEHRCEYRIHNAYYSGKPDRFWIDPQWTGQERREYANQLGMSKGNAYLSAKQGMRKSAEIFCELQFWNVQLTITDDLTGEEIFHDQTCHVDDYKYAEKILLVDGHDILSIMQAHVAEREEIELTTFADWALANTLA